VYVEGRIISQVIFHKLNTLEEREHALNHLTGLRVRLQLTKAEAESFDGMLDCLRGRAGITPLDTPQMVNSWGDPSKPWVREHKHDTKQ
jgi:hypothetical protein